MKVSIITVCHNQLHHTKRFISSLRRFTPLESVEVILIDSGSTDKTWEWWESNREAHWSGAKFNSNLGWVRGINEGLKSTRLDWADIIIFANNDVVLDRPGWLERLYAHFDNPTVGAVGPTSNYVIGRQNISCDVPHIAEEPTNVLIGFFFAVRKEIVDRLGGLDESLSPGGIGGGDDFDYSIRIRRDGWKLVIARDVFVWHSGSKTFFETLGQDGYNQHWRACDKAIEKKWGEIEAAQLFSFPQRTGVAIPLRGWHPHWKFTKSLMYLNKPINWNLIEAPRAVIDQARNGIVEAAKSMQMTELLFLDDDHIFQPDLYWRLAAHNKDVVGALGFRRIAPYGPCMFDWETDRTNGNLMVRDRPDLIKKGLQKVDAIGFGAVLVKMSVFDKLGAPPWFKFSEVGEDLHFCDLCAQKGIEVFCDTDLIIPHITDEGMEITDLTFLEYHKFNKQSIA